MSLSPTAAPAPEHDGSWAGHVRATLKMGLPLVAAQVAQVGIQATDTVMLGWLGVEELAASVLGSTLFFVAFIFTSGLAYAVMPLAANAEGEGDPRGVRRAVRMGAWAVIGLAALLMPVLWNGQGLLRATGQEEALLPMAERYLRILQWGLFPAALFMVFRSYLSALEHTAVILWATLAGVLLNAALNWALIFGNWGAPALGLEGAAIASLGTHTLMFAIITVYALTLRGLRKYQVFVRVLRPDWYALREVLRLGLPISGTLLAEVGLFAASSLMMGRLGTVPLAAHGIALQIISVFFMVPYGLSSAGTVRVGRALGRRDAQGLWRAGLVVTVLAAGIAVAVGVLLWVAPEPLLLLFLDDADPRAPEILATGTTLLAVAAVFQLVDTLQAISAGLLRGIRDTRIPMLIAIFSYWGLGVPSAWIMGLTLGWGGVGIWGGLALGLAVAATLLTWRFIRLAPLSLSVDGQAESARARA